MLFHSFLLTIITMNNKFEYQFWFWSNKLDAILIMLAALIKYELLDVERQIIKSELEITNDENNKWYNYPLAGKEIKLDLKFAYDNEEGKDVIHLIITSSTNLTQQLETLDLFQSLFKKIK